MKYRVNSDTLARQMADELVLVNTVSNKIFVANESAAALWRAIQDGADLDTVIRCLAESAPDSNAARTEIADFLAGLQREGFLAPG
jgi:hypothetical protein